MNFFVLSNVRNSDLPVIHFSFKPGGNGGSVESVDESESPPAPDKRIIVSTSIYNYLCKSKKTIETCNVDDWDAMKKYTNPYEFIHTIVPGHRCAISKMRPLSRSFYKMVEIIKHCKLLPGCTHNHHYHQPQQHRATATATATATIESSSPSSSASSSSFSGDTAKSHINTFHLAEGPGGFIEALVHVRGNPDDVYHGMTLVDEHSFSCPGWKKSRAFLERNTNVRLEYGADGTGNLLSLENYDACCAKYRQQMHFISADGGFDFSANFNNQESLAQNLVVAEVLYAITMQRFEGSFVLKIFDIFTKVTVDLLQLLCCVYDDVIVFKPNTSRIANSEKYVVCKRFNIRDRAVHDDLVKNFRAFFIGIGEVWGDNIEIAGVLNTGGADDRHNMQLLNRIEEINAILGQQQIDNITMTISMIQTKTYDKLDAYKRANVQKCVAWCERYDIPCNKNVVSTNTFITSTTNATAGAATT